VTRLQRRSLNLAQQAGALRQFSSDAVVHFHGHSLEWEGVLTPTWLSRDYVVRIRYTAGNFPRVVVLDPPLEPNEHGELPHFYRDGSVCLHEPHQWDESMLIADTILPWISEWLVYYELWRRSGVWYGNTPVLSKSISTDGLATQSAPLNRAERRRRDREVARTQHSGHAVPRHAG
jgi:hypothetical protein